MLPIFRSPVYSDFDTWDNVSVVVREMFASPLQTTDYSPLNFNLGSLDFSISVLRHCHWSKV